jgi:hypothetical protein
MHVYQPISPQIPSAAQLSGTPKITVSKGLQPSQSSFSQHLGNDEDKNCTAKTTPEQKIKQGIASSGNHRK